MRFGAGPLEQHGSRPESEPEVHAPDRLAAQAELRVVLDQEIARLSSAHRTALVLCDLEGRSPQDAARLLGWSEGALRGRLARARRKLRDRLERRGIAPALLPTGASLLPDTVGPGVSSALIEATTRAGMATVLAGRATPSAGSVISTSVAALVQGVIHTMTLSKVKILGFIAILATVGLLAVGGFVRGGLARIEAEPVGQPPKTVAEQTKPRMLDLHVVRRSDQQPIPGAMVEVARFDKGSWHVTKLTTDAEGRCAIELSGGTVSMSIAIAKDGFVPIRRPIDEKDHAQSPSPTLTQELEPGQPIGGFVRDEQGRPIAGAAVTVAISQGRYDFPDEDVPGPADPRLYAGLPFIQVKTDDQGRWRCSILPVKADPTTRLWFFVEHPDHVSDTGGYSRRLSIKTARAMTGALIMDSGANVRGQVRDGKNQPVAGARVVLAYSGNSGDWAKTTTDAEGRYRFDHANDRGGLGRWSLSVQAPGFAPSWMMVVPKGAIPPADFRLAPGKPFRGKVVDAKGQPVAGVSVFARWEECYSLDWKAETDAEGRFVWPDAPSVGEIAFRIQKRGYSVGLDRNAPAPAGQAELTINPELRARGTVVDAESKQPVRAFTVFSASSFQDDSEIHWRRARGVKGSEGRYEVTVSRMDQPRTVFHVRIEAEGYAPAISRAIKPDEGEVTLDFALKKAREVSGVVRLPDGTPAAGADVYIDGDGYTFDRASGPPPAPGYLAPEHRKTGPDGRYTFPPQDEPFGILTVHDKGFGDRTREEMAQSPDVTLKPWAAHRGNLPDPGQTGHPSTDRRQSHSLGHRAELRLAVLFGHHRRPGAIRHRSDPGRRGRFPLVERQASHHDAIDAGPAVDVRPGQTVHVHLGGQGRPLIGQVVLSAPDEAKADDRVSGVNIANAHGWLEIKPSQMPIPPDFRTWDTQKQRAYRNKWFHTEPGRAYMRTRRYHMFPIGADGRFRIEDVVPGSYNLRIGVQSTPGMTHALTRNRLGATIERDVEVGAIPGGHSDEPLDLGKIPLKLERQN